jgi:hypothetical protein
VQTAVVGLAPHLGAFGSSLYLPGTSDKNPDQPVTGSRWPLSGTTEIRKTGGTSTVAIHAFNHDTADGFDLPLADANRHYCIGLLITWAILVGTGSGRVSLAQRRHTAVSGESPKLHAL